MRYERMGFPAGAFVVLALILAGCPAPADRPGEVDFPPESEPGEIPFRFAGPGEAALVVPVFLHGEGPFDFVLDTGATLTCIEQSLAGRLGLRERSTPAMGSTVAGTGRMTIVDVDSIRVGQASARDLSACVLDLDHIAEAGVEVSGLLGLNFLRSFRVTLDFERDVLVLERP